ncbi:FAD dependent oxidoreductase [Hydrogenispora ethanolica]|uniref:FAD dependent oxidoreductase n=1 Tax=Hydrogenispora ethanolica TaxID=1082276 RepID=A0A4R1R7E9_HYDET|nr:FAD-dependent oxidoreductase [Hydrogenispora ethanolica]TCL61488.1 FAD dependent oxidoreductase [Hydrogenispora ethanolica]
MIDREYQVVVVGGGMAGVCAAIASARHGARTALIHNRPVLGGNASSEIRMHIVGANCHGTRPDARETGILEEILLENRRRNPGHSFSIFDTVLWEKVRFQEGLDLYLNTQMTGVEVAAGRIRAVEALQLTTEKQFRFTAAIFVDCTGDGTLAYQAGAACRVGRESRDEFGEQYAPERADRKTMGNTLLFQAVDTGAPVPFEKPFWAHSFGEADLAFRGHSAYASAMEHYEVDSGYWWIELGGEEDTIADGEAIRDELLKTVYGVWDHIKNRGDHGAANYALEWVGFLPGKRESRRIMGDYILKEQDCLSGRLFPDAVAYGGWPMDMHPPEGFRYKGDPNQFLRLNDVYTIPYRCYCARDIANLMMAGRNISASHMAFGSIRVMGTCSAGGQAVGTAAALAVRQNCPPGGLTDRIQELQQLLLRDDCYIPGVANQDPEDRARRARIAASSAQPDGAPEQVVNGVARRVGGVSNCWISEDLAASGEWLELQWDEPLSIREVHLKFDSNLSGEIMPTLSKTVRKQQIPGLPPELVKDYELQLWAGDQLRAQLAVEGNGLRFRTHRLAEPTYADRLRILVRGTHGAAEARLFEVRVY